MRAHLSGCALRLYSVHLGAARFGVGIAVYGSAWRGAVGLGMGEGGAFGLRPPHVQSDSGSGSATQCLAGKGSASCGPVWRGRVRHGKGERASLRAPFPCPLSGSRYDRTWNGQARTGRARNGQARQGWAWERAHLHRCALRMYGFDSGGARLGSAGLGSVGCGMRLVWQGKGERALSTGALSMCIVAIRRGTVAHGTAGTGIARRGAARSGAAGQG